MKVVIPVAGIGIKLRPHTHTQPKTLVPIAGKAILGHIVENFIEAGIKDFIFVIGYLGDKIESYIKSNYPDIKATFVVQEPREGLAHAIYVAREHIIKEKDILIALGDTIVNLDIHKLIESKHSVLAVKKVESPGRFGVAEIDKDGRILKLIEKPKIPKSNLALVGIYKINNPKHLIKAIESNIRNNFRTQNEFHLTDAMMKLIEQGESFFTMQVNNWYDCGKKETLLETNAILLHRPGFVSNESKDFPGTIIIPPVSIGKNAVITSSILGPNVAIGENTIVNTSIIRNTIVGSFSEMECVVLNNSIVGSDTSIKGLNQSLNIGDNTEINFNS
jgi:glucose-1-phosphate thymidylyltransferase